MPARLVPHAARRGRSRSACTSPRAGCGRTSSAAARPFCAWVLPRLRAPRCRGLGDAWTPTALYRAVNRVQPSLIRVEADETTYNLHIVLRFELELALIEGRLAVDDLPEAWNEAHAPAARPRGARRRPGRAAGHPLGRRADRLLPDLHARAT